MLIERWQQTVAHRGSELALWDLASNTRWTFAALGQAADSFPSPAPGSPSFPVARGPEFILALLAAWRVGAAVCPLEPGQSVPILPPPPFALTHLKLTSGTSGEPKCVAMTAEQLAADAAAIVATMGLSAETPNLAVISLAHSYGFSNLVLPLLLHGIPLLLAPSPLPAALRQAAQTVSSLPLTLPAVPAMWRAWHEARSIPQNVRLAISAGAPLPLSIETEVFKEHGLKIHNFLGASECGGIAYDASQVPRSDPALAGSPLRGVQLSIGHEGCLEVRGPAVGTRYWPQSSAALEEGVFRTEDLADWDAAGGLLLRGRRGDQINVAGRKVSPESIERVLREHPSVRDCLVLGLASGDLRGETIVAIVEANPPLEESELRNFLLERLPPWQVPRAWHWTTALTPSARGKLSRAEWRERLRIS